MRKLLFFLLYAPQGFELCFWPLCLKAPNEKLGAIAQGRKAYEELLKKRTGIFRSVHLDYANVNFENKTSLLIIT